MKWSLVTASFGQMNFHESALRLLDQARASGAFSEYFHITEENLMDYAPHVWRKYKSQLNSNCRGFGYYAWKAEIVHTIFKNDPEKGIAYVDAGCEIKSNMIAKLRLRRMLKEAESGSYLHVLNYPEIMYTKKKVLDYFSLSQSDALSPQIQATWFFLAGYRAQAILDSWLAATLEDISLLDDSTGSEHEKFIQHRYDQSLFSCAIKHLKIDPSQHRPCFRPETLKSTLRCLVHPIWSARNRSGVPLGYFERVRSFN